jgi:hypothetical protein
MLEEILPIGIDVSNSGANKNKPVSLGGLGIMDRKELDSKTLRAICMLLLMPSLSNMCRLSIE